METWSLIDGRWQPGDVPGASARWFDVVGSAEPALDDLAERFHLHPLSIEDCRSGAYHAPKVDQFPEHLFLVLQSARGANDLELPELEELDVFLGHDFLVTYQDVPLAAIAEVRGALTQGREVRPGPDGLLYEIADRVVDDQLPVVGQLSERLEALQQQVLEVDLGDLSSKVMAIRAHAGRLRRVIVPELSVLQRLSRGEFDEIQAPNLIYFRDVYDHLVRLDFALEGLREDTEVALNTHLSVINNRMNEVMKVLSVVSALALPAVVIAGIFGTNFDSVPGLHSNWGFLAMIASMTGLAASMAWWFKTKRWW